MTTAELKFEMQELSRFESLLIRVSKNILGSWWKSWIFESMFLGIHVYNIPKSINFASHEKYNE